MTCSAASFAEARSSARPPSGRVPLIGRVRSRRPLRRRNSSGEAETIAQPFPSKTRQALSPSGASFGWVRDGEPGGERARRCPRTRPRDAGRD